MWSGNRWTGRGRHRARLLGMLVSLFLGLTVMARGEAPPLQTGAPDTIVRESAHSGGAADSASVSAAPAKDATATDAPPNWIARVDGFFGSWLVAPLATVLFYDLRSVPGVGPALAAQSEKPVPFVVLWLLLGACFCTLRMGFINLRGFWHAVRLTKGDYDHPDHPGEVSHFQALASALSATVGLGNIAGVAIAVLRGGPGAVFWLVVAGLLGMSSKFAECSLAQMYRKVAPDGTVSGGPMHYLRDGLAEIGLKPLGVVLGILFAVMCVGGSFGGGCAFQVGQSLAAIQQQVPLLKAQPWIYGVVMVVMTGLVILGGIRRIAAVADKIVPVMCGLYVVSSLMVIATYWQQVPGALATIWQGAFSPAAMYGGFLGVMVIGIQRAAFSNEAGVGSAAIAHSAARTTRPISEGIVALLEPFIDTVVVCTMTGLVMVITGAYQAPQHAELIAAENGAALTAEAFGGVATVFRWTLSLTVFLFAYSTMISWSYYGERCWSHLFGPRLALVYKLLFLVFAFLGSIVTARNVLDFSDLMILSMSLPNLLGVMLLSGKVKRELDVYWADYQAGRLEIG